MEGMIFGGTPPREGDKPPSAEIWIPWLKGELEALDIPTSTPEMPVPFRPNYEAWKTKFELKPIPKDNIMIAHSAGAAFLIRWLGENEGVELDTLVLVAPWFDPYNIHGKLEFLKPDIEIYRGKEKEFLKPDGEQDSESYESHVHSYSSQEKEFFTFDIDPTIPARVNNLHIIHGTGSPVPGEKNSLRKLKRAWGENVIYHMIKGGGHFLGDESPEVLNIIKEILENRTATNNLAEIVNPE